MPNGCASFEGDHVFLKRVGNGVLILPSKEGWDTLIQSVGQFSEDFMAERDQPEQQSRSDRRARAVES